MVRYLRNTVKHRPRASAGPYKYYFRAVARGVLQGFASASSYMHFNYLVLRTVKYLEQRGGVLSQCRVGENQ